MSHSESKLLPTYPFKPPVVVLGTINLSVRNVDLIHIYLTRQGTQG